MKGLFNYVVINQASSLLNLVAFCIFYYYLDLTCQENVFVLLGKLRLKTLCTVTSDLNKLNKNNDKKFPWNLNCTDTIENLKRARQILTLRYPLILFY